MKTLRPELTIGSRRVRVGVALGVIAWSIAGVASAASAPRDGNGIDFTGATEIHTINDDGTSQTRLTVNACDDMSPVWSPDGTKLAISSDRDGNIEIHTMNADGSTRRA